MLAAYVPKAVFEAVGTWVGMGPERTYALFLREAAREKLRREGVKFSEDQNAITT